MLRLRVCMNTLRGFATMQHTPSFRVAVHPPESSPAQRTGLQSANTSLVELMDEFNPCVVFTGGKKRDTTSKVPIQSLILSRLSPSLVLCSLKPGSPTPKDPDPESCMEEPDLTRGFALEFASDAEADNFVVECDKRTKQLENSDGTAEQRNKANTSSHLSSMDPSIVQTYFQYYGKMANQMNMLQDSVRTSLYRKAIVENPDDFRGKTVMDIGAGTGILSFFAAQARAAKVYAVEASSMADVIRLLIPANPELGKDIVVVSKTLETIGDEDIPGKVDVLVSEPIGTFLFNERMIETYLYARDKFLKPGGKMFPNKCQLAVAPFTDQALYSDMANRSQFWRHNNFFGVNLSAAAPRAFDEQFKQPIVDYVDPSILLCSPHFEKYDFETIDRKDLEHIVISFEFLISSPCLVHGIAGWFDVLFQGSQQEVGFSTSPWCTPTHWYQIRFLLKQPIAVNPGQTVVGCVKMDANNQQSYYVHTKLQIAGTDITSESAIIDLKDPDYRYYTNPSCSYYPNVQHNYQQQGNTFPSYTSTGGSASFHSDSSSIPDAQNPSSMPPYGGANTLFCPQPQRNGHMPNPGGKRSDYFNPNEIHAANEEVNAIFGAAPATG